jgi:hypothetical protein
MIEGKAQTREVFIHGIKLDYAHSLTLRRHSPGGGAWGYRGSGPAQLSLALLLCFTTETEALRRYQHFKEDLVAPLPIDQDFTWPASLIEAWLEDRPCAPDAELYGGQEP